MWLQDWSLYYNICYETHSILPIALRNGLRFLEEPRHHCTTVHRHMGNLPLRATGAAALHG